MNYIDIALIIIFIGAVIRGAQIGFVSQILSTIGFFSGLFLGAWIGPHIVHFAHTASSRSWLTLLFTFGCAPASAGQPARLAYLICCGTQKN